MERWHKIKNFQKKTDDNSFGDEKFRQFLDSFSNLFGKIFSHKLKVGNSMLNDLLNEVFNRKQKWAIPKLP